MTSWVTFTPIWRHWSISQIACGSYGIGMPRFFRTNVRFSAPASLRRRRASARAALMSRP